MVNVNIPEILLVPRIYGINSEFAAHYKKAVNRFTLDILTIVGTFMRKAFVKTQFINKAI